MDKKKINLYLTAAAAGFLTTAGVLFIFWFVGEIFISWPNSLKIVTLGAAALLLAAAAAARAAAIIILEGVLSWLQGLKVLVGDFLLIFFHPRLWKLSLISFYRPYHLARWEAERLDLKKFELTDRDLIYGETPYFSLKKIIREIRPGGGEELFVDLGSGIGKTVFFVSLYFGLPSLGIEINPALYKAAMEIKEKLSIKKAVFIGGNVLDQDWGEGTVFYVHGTTWSEAVYQKLTQKFEETKPGAVILSVTHQLNAPFLKFIKEIKIDLNWSREPLYIYQRM